MLLIKESNRMAGELYTECACVTLHFNAPTSLLRSSIVDNFFKNLNNGNAEDLFSEDLLLSIIAKGDDNHF